MVKRTESENKNIITKNPPTYPQQSFLSQSRSVPAQKARSALSGTALAKNCTNYKTKVPNNSHSWFRAPFSQVSCLGFLAQLKSRVDHEFQQSETNLQHND
jgi:hypothetical protein